MSQRKPRDDKNDSITAAAGETHSNLLPEVPEDVAEHQEIRLLQERQEESGNVFRRSYLLAARTLRLQRNPSEPSVSASAHGSVAVGGDIQGVVATGDNSTIYITQKAEVKVPETVRRREDFFENFLKETYRQAQTNFIISTIFTCIGCVIFLGGSIVAAVQALHGHPASVSIISSLGGAILAGSGAAIALRADRSKKYLGEQARLVHEEIKEQYRLAQAATFLDALRDSELKDRLLVTAALQRLDPKADVSLVLQQLLRDQNPTDSGKDKKQKDRGDST